MDSKWLNVLNLSFGPQRARKLLRRFGSGKNIWQASRGALASAGLEQKSLDEIFARKEALNPEEEWKRLKEHNVELIVSGSTAYPELLREIHAPPLVLYARGNTKLLNTPSIAVVGTRSHSSYAKTVMPAFIRDLTSAGLTIVSGLAQGIDSLAHDLTLGYGGNTVAVLGCGLHQIFPKMNASLAERILAQKGLIISEYPLGVPPLKQHFPARNRIIAGLSAGVLVIESRSKGGALITARQALEANREVFALPGPVHLATSQGTNQLIQEGAKLVIKAEDILEELAIPLTKHELKSTLEALSPAEQKIVELLEIEPLHIDTIIKHVKLKPAAVNSLMTSLELKGVVQNTGGNIYTRRV